MFFCYRVDLIGVIIPVLPQVFLPQLERSHRRIYQGRRKPVFFRQIGGVEAPEGASDKYQSTRVLGLDYDLELGHGLRGPMPHLRNQDILSHAPLLAIAQGLLCVFGLGRTEKTVEVKYGGRCAH